MESNLNKIPAKNRLSKIKNWKSINNSLKVTMRNSSFTWRKKLKTRKKTKRRRKMLWRKQDLSQTKKYCLRLKNFSHIEWNHKDILLVSCNTISKWQNLKFFLITIYLACSSMNPSSWLSHTHLFSSNIVLKRKKYLIQKCFNHLCL